jgi:SAM-dependent methyltransferase
MRIRSATGPERIVICRECGLIYLNPRWTVDRYREFYQKEYRDVVGVGTGDAEHRLHLKESSRRGSHIVAFCRDYVSRDDTILEIGSGNGGILWAFKLAGYENVLGIEPNVSESEFTRRVLGIRCTTGMLEDASIPDGSLAFTMIAASVDHLQDPFGYFRTIHALTKPGGLLYVDGYDALAAMKRGQCAAKMDHCYYYTPETMTALLARSGWDVVKFDTFNTFRGVPSQRRYWDVWDGAGMHILARKVEPHDEMPSKQWASSAVSAALRSRSVLSRASRAAARLFA